MMVKYLEPTMSLTPDDKFPTEVIMPETHLVTLKTRPRSVYSNVCMSALFSTTHLSCQISMSLLLVGTDGIQIFRQFGASLERSELAKQAPVVKYCE